jgi:hypothetical protein
LGTYRLDYSTGNEGFLTLGTIHIGELNLGD